MYAVVSSGGKQYRVEPGSTLTMERLGADVGAPFTFDRVLLIGDGDQVTVGTPLVSGATVSATVLGEELGPKLVIFKFKQKVKYRRRTGHRQHLVRVRIDGINAEGKSTRSKAASAATEVPAATEEPTEEKPKRTRKPRAAKASETTAIASEASAEKTKPARKPRTTKAKPATEE